MSSTLTVLRQRWFISFNIPSIVASESVRRVTHAVLPWILPVVLLVLWQAGSYEGWISAQVLPSPLSVLTSLGELSSSGDLWISVEASLRRVLLGFVAGSLIGLLLGAAMGLSPRLESYVGPTFNALVQIPVLAWLPFVLLLVGIGEALKYILIAKAALVPVTLSTLQVFRQTPESFREVAQVYGYTRRQEIFEIVLPWSIPTLFTGLRLGFTKAWLSLVVVELVASSEGLGYLIVYGRQLFQLDLVMAAVMVVGGLGYLIDKLFDFAESRMSRHHSTSQSGMLI